MTAERVVDDGVESLSVDATCASVMSCSSDRAAGSPPTASSSTAKPRSTSDDHRRVASGLQVGR